MRQYAGDFALILLDIVMPIMNWYEFLAAVKAAPEFAAIPVIVTTQNDRELEEVTALSCGAADFVAKPISRRSSLPNRCRLNNSNGWRQHTVGDNNNRFRAALS